MKTLLLHLEPSEERAISYITKSIDPHPLCIMSF